MTTADIIANVLRNIAPDKRLLAAEIPLIDAIALNWDTRDRESAPPQAAPPWLYEARKHMGVTEIPGKRHNPLVVAMWKILKRPYTDDETPWCGAFVGYCFQQAIPTLPLPAIPERARVWAEWGKNSAPVVGAVAVFGRQGGGHVGFAVGQSNNHIYVLGGNQSNQVNVMPISKSRLLGFRWPAGLSSGEKALPRMTGGKVSRNEA